LPQPVAVPAVELRAYRYLREVLDNEDGKDVITLSLGFILGKTRPGKRLHNELEIHNF